MEMEGSRRLWLCCGLALLVVIGAVGIDGSLSCMDQDGKAVGWWVMLKNPIISGSSDPLLQEGYGYLYADANNPTLTYPQMSLNDTDGALYRTLHYIYSKSSSTAYYLYDDEHPDGSKYDSFGHTKGCVALNSEEGFWLIHSVPRFPVFPGPSQFFFPEDEAKYGQSFLCLSLTTSDINTVAGLQLIDKPSVFASSLTNPVSSAAPNVVSLVGGKSWVTTPTNTSEVVTTSDGTDFIVFAKNSEWNSELYEYAVAPELEADLYVESWMDGVGPLPSYCKPKYTWDVQDVRKLAFPGDADFAWLETQDHSKWAVTQDGAKYVCIGDINRQNGQLSRGGGTACQLNPTLWSSFTDLIASADSC